MANICPTTEIDTIVPVIDKRGVVPMRWGLVPSWWSKTLKEMRLATFNARAETAAEKPMFHEEFDPNQCNFAGRAMHTHTENNCVGAGF